MLRETKLGKYGAEDKVTDEQVGWAVNEWANEREKRLGPLQGRRLAPFVAYLLDHFYLPNLDIAGLQIREKPWLENGSDENRMYRLLTAGLTSQQKVDVCKAANSVAVKLGKGILAQNREDILAKQRETAMPGDADITQLRRGAFFRNKRGKRG